MMGHFLRCMGKPNLKKRIHQGVGRKGGGLYQIEINHGWCKNCYICIDLCAKKVYSKSEKVSPKGARPVEIRHLEACTGCMQCELLCPDLAITVTKE